nr:deoxycytidylate deaminase [Zonotrichia albicollis]
MLGRNNQHSQDMNIIQMELGYRNGPTEPSEIQNQQMQSPASRKQMPLRAFPCLNNFSIFSPHSLCCPQDERKQVPVKRRRVPQAGYHGSADRSSEASCKKREDYLEWPEYFMAVAFLSAQRSKDPSSQVGACIVNSENKIVGIGYNGMPNGCSDDVLPWTRTAANRLDTKYPYVCHAELNAIMNKNSADVKGCSMYVALFPCNECAKLIIQAGIKEVIFMSDKYHDTTEMTAARRLFDLAGIIYREFKPKCNKIVIDFDSINSRPSQKLL